MIQSRLGSTVLGVDMKKLLIILAIVLMASVAWADQEVYLGWVPEPNSDVVISQEVWHDPDTTVADNEVMKASLSKTTGSLNFTIIGDDLPNDVVWIRTNFMAGDPHDTIALAPVNVAGATILFMFQR